MHARETGEVLLQLLTLSHPGLAAPIRVVNDHAQLVSGGNTYLPFAFSVGLPNESADSPPRTTIRIDNVDRQIVEAVRSVSGDPLQVDISAVLASTPNTIEIGPIRLSMRLINYDDATVTGQLQFEDILLDAFPGDLYTPATFPGNFA